MESLAYNVLEQLYSDRGREATYSSLTYSYNKPANIFPMNLTQLEIRMKVLCSAPQRTNMAPHSATTVALRMAKQLF